MEDMKNQTTTVHQSTHNILVMNRQMADEKLVTWVEDHTRQRDAHLDRLAHYSNEGLHDQPGIRTHMLAYRLHDEVVNRCSEVFAQDLTLGELDAAVDQSIRDLAWEATMQAAVEEGDV